MLVHHCCYILLRRRILRDACYSSNDDNYGDVGVVAACSMSSMSSSISMIATTFHNDADLVENGNVVMVMGSI